VTGHRPSAAASGVNSFNHSANGPKGTRIRLETLFTILLYILNGGRLGLRPSPVTPRLVPPGGSNEPKEIEKLDGGRILTS
jgi:hypothetical protein